MALKLDVNFDRAFALLKRSLDEGVLIFKPYNSNLINCGIIHNYSICNVGRDVDDDANLTLNLDYAITEPDEIGCLVTYEKHRQLNLFCSLGDCEWTHNMIDYVWDGDYPSTVGVDNATGDVFLVYIRNNSLEFQYFAQLDNDELHNLETDLNYSRPYKIGVSERALFLALDGAEGYNYLKKNVYIDFNTIPPLRVDIEYTVDRVC